MKENLNHRTVTILAIATVLVVAGSFFLPSLAGAAAIPLLSAVTDVRERSREFLVYFADKRLIAEENTAMKAELIRAEASLQRAEMYDTETVRLRKLLDLKWEQPALQLTEARVIGYTAGNFRSGFTINTDRVSEGDLVITENGLAGIVTHAGAGFAEAASVIDPGFAVGVRMLRTDEAGLASGDFELMGKGYLAIGFVNDLTGLEPGDLAETSGSGTPEGILVGSIAQTDDGLVLDPVVDVSRLLTVYVVTGW